MNQTNWETITPSQFPWEREALDFVRQHLPKLDTYQAWSNFEFIATDGSINEVDLLVFSPRGFFLVEIKSRPGRIQGDAGTWTWQHDGRLYTTDNPLRLANLKAKKLRSLLERQKVGGRRPPIPYIEALVFCSAPDLRCDLTDTAAYRICLRDRPPDIMAALLRRDCPGLRPQPQDNHNRPLLQAIRRALASAGIRPSQQARRVSDYQLQTLLDNGPDYQDWQAEHVRMHKTRRRIRLYLRQAKASREDRQRLDRAARREFQLLENLQHPGILRCNEHIEHDLGPALLFEHDPEALRLDRYLVQHKEQLSTDRQLNLLRQIAEAVQFAHEHRVIHRGLCPQSILVFDPEGDRPQVKLFNWQIAYQEGGTTSSSSSGVATVTSQVESLVEDANTAYMAPETFSNERLVGEHLDVFSLGAIAFHLFSYAPPAANHVDLAEKLRVGKGLQLSAVRDGTPQSLQTLIQSSTQPVVEVRCPSVSDFLDELEAVESKLTEPENWLNDPTQAQQGDVLAGNWRVLKRLGQGGSAVALLVEQDRQCWILKAANDPENNERLRDEAEVLQQLRHPYIVECKQTAQIGDRLALLLQPVFVERSEKKQQIETLGQRLRRDGRLHLDLLQRFGDDLLDAIAHLEEKGIVHRDIKPDNIAIGQLGRGGRLHAVLFDFSLTRLPLDNLRAGTSGYLDPLLPVRPHKRWDLAAERYAAAVTLYEMATGTLPRWGDGMSDPSFLDCEISLEADLFDASVRDRLHDFFQQALRREVSERFDNAEEMLRAWRECFADLVLASSDRELAALQVQLERASFETPIRDLGLGARVASALDRANILTVADLLATSGWRLRRLRGVGHGTRRTINEVAHQLRARLGLPSDDPEDALDRTTAANAIEITSDTAQPSLDWLAQRLRRPAAKDNATMRQTLAILLGDAEPDLRWPSQAEIAERVGVTRGRVAQLLGKLQKRWLKLAPFTTLRGDLAELLPGAGGVMALDELAAALAIARGSAAVGFGRIQLARAVIRAAVEAERNLNQPRFQVRRSGDRLWVTTSSALGDYARELGDRADRLAEQEPLLSAERVIQELRAVPRPPGVAELAEPRLLSLAVASAGEAALSARQELYPRQMSATRALRLSRGALLGVQQLDVEQIRDRVSSRYPEAAPLPERPQLDAVLREAGLELEWDWSSKCYRAPAAAWLSSSQSLAPSQAGDRTPMASPVVSERRLAVQQFAARLQQAQREGAFLALLASPLLYEQARDQLAQCYSVAVVDFEELFLAALQGATAQAGADWSVVLAADAQPGQGDWDKLLVLVGRAMAVVEACLLAIRETVLLVYPGLLARYERLGWLEQMRDRLGQADGLAGLWVLVPSSTQAAIDGRPIPLLDSRQRLRVPDAWLAEAASANRLDRDGE